MNMNLAEGIMLLFVVAMKRLIGMSVPPISGEDYTAEAGLQELFAEIMISTFSLLPFTIFLRTLIFS